MKFKILRFKKLISTNDTAIRMIRSSNLMYGMIIAERQINGRGQYGRKWISLKGNLFVSFFYNLNNINLNMTQITKINCVLVKKLISKYYKKRIIYKKPNDLLIKGKKICGILQETINKLNKKFLIVGIGINLVKNPVIKDYPVINLNDLINKKISKKKIEIELKNIFEKNLKKFVRIK
jgi:BirA family biotin operon repressor/biotin-[acetyl-CoA-carboxylase] ligase